MVDLRDARPPGKPTYTLTSCPGTCRVKLEPNDQRGEKIVVLNAANNNHLATLKPKQSLETGTVYVQNRGHGVVYMQQPGRRYTRRLKDNTAFLMTSLGQDQVFKTVELPPHEVVHRRGHVYRQVACARCIDAPF